MKKLTWMIAALSLCASTFVACSDDSKDDAKKANGDTCSVAEECDSNYCNDAKKCADAPKAKGDVCTASSECAEGLYCAKDGDANWLMLLHVTVLKPVRAVSAKVPMAPKFAVAQPPKRKKKTVYPVQMLLNARAVNAKVPMAPKFAVAQPPKRKKKSVHPALMPQNAQAIAAKVQTAPKFA